VYGGSLLKKKSVSTSGRLESVSLKLERAAGHLREIKAIDATFADVELNMPFVRDEERGVGYFEVRLPEPPAAIGPIVGDCLHNLRSCLDYLVWQVVRSNPPHTPSRKNMFPVCQLQSAFDEQVKRGRLDGVPLQAVAVVKSLQPFDSPEHPLALLDELYNADKHRDLNLAISVASDMDVVHLRNGEVVMRTILGGEDVRNGAVYGDIAISLDAVPLGVKMEVVGRAAAFVAFKDLASKGDEPMPVVQTLEEMLSLLVNLVVPRFGPFIR
jgi:hypothetical protein